MAVIAATNVNVSGVKTTARTTLTASDTLVFNPSYNPVLILDNVTAGALTVNIKGNATTTIPVKGVGTVDLSTGFPVGSLAAGAFVCIPLNSISEYLKGTSVAVTGGTGIKATLLEYV